MKAQILKLVTTERIYPTNSDFTSQVFNHPELNGICRDRGPSVRDKLIALIAGNVMRDHLLEEQKRQSAERTFTLAAIARNFTSNTGVAAPVALTTTGTEASKSLFERIGALAVVIPVLALLALGAAAWKTNETTSWKNASDGNKELVSTLKEQVRVTNEEKKDLQEKNDSLQQDIRNLLTIAAADSKTDAKSLADSINKLLSKQHSIKVGMHSVTESTAPPGN